MVGIDWLPIKNEYINTNTSYRKLAEKYGVSKDTIARRAQTENWIRAKDKQCDKIQTKVLQKTADKIVAKEISRIDRALALADTLLTKCEQAATELDCHEVINKVSAKKYALDANGNKLEITTENKKISYKPGIIKVNEIKQLASALKDLKEVQTGNMDIEIDVPKVIDDI